MAADVALPAGEENLRWRFGLPGLMVLILGVALGLGEYKSRVKALPPQAPGVLVSAQGALRAANVTVGFWLVMGLLTQSLRLRSMRRHVPAGDRRFSNTLGMAFRLGLAVVIVAYHLWEHVYGAAAIRRQSAMMYDAPRAAADYYRVAYFGALVLVACLSRQTHGFWRRFAAPEALLILWTLAIPAAAMGLCDRLTESMLGTSFQGVPGAAGNRVWVMLHIVLFVPAGMAAIYLLARGNVGPRRKRIYLAVLAASLALQTPVLGLLWWPRLWKALSEANTHLVEFVIAGVPCVIMLATLVAYRMTVRIEKSPADTTPKEQTPLAISWHEHRLVWVLLGGVLWLDFWFGWLWYARLNNFAFSSLSTIGYLVTSESVIPHLLAAVVACMAGLTRFPSGAVADETAVAPRRFWWTFAAVNVVSLLAIVSIALLVFLSQPIAR